MRKQWLFSSIADFQRHGANRAVQRITHIYVERAHMLGTNEKLRWIHFNKNGKKEIHIHTELQRIVIKNGPKKHLSVHHKRRCMHIFMMCSKLSGQSTDSPSIQIVVKTHTHDYVCVYA